MIDPARRDDPEALERDFELLEISDAYVSNAMLGIPGRKLEQTILDWATGHMDYDPDERQSQLIMDMAADACLFQPSMSGTTPMDRFLQELPAGDPMAEFL